MSEKPANEGITTEDLNRFLDGILYAQNTAQPGETPSMEAPRKVVEHFNRGKMEGVEVPGYFIYQGVKVFIEGAKAESEKKDAMTTEDKLFGVKK